MREQYLITLNCCNSAGDPTAETSYEIVGYEGRLKDAKVYAEKYLRTNPKASLIIWVAKMGLELDEAPLKWDKHILADSQA